jgi:RimJ/RimL family protein N-acetyltransferase
MKYLDFIKMDTIKTSRLELRELTVKDVTDDYVSWLNDSVVNQYLESRFSEQNHKDIQGFIRESNSDPSTILFGIFIKKNMKHIGNIKIGSIDTNHKRASIGILIGDIGEWGNGYASESIQMITRFCFDKLSLVKISAGCYESNIGSKKAFEKAGYKVEGFLDSHVETQHGREGCWQLGIVAC